MMMFYFPTTLTGQTNMFETNQTALKDPRSLITYFTTSNLHTKKKKIENEAA